MEASTVARTQPKHRFTYRPTAVPDQTPATPKPAKPAHRERLLTAVTDAIADRGYHATTVAEVIAYAGVSRATFYEHFADKDACVLAAYQQAATHTKNNVTTSASLQKRSFNRERKPPKMVRYYQR